MRFPLKTKRRPYVQQLPSLITFFPTTRTLQSHGAVEVSPAGIEEGLQVVPIERQDTSCMKMLSPDPGEKEVVPGYTSGYAEMGLKPLPRLPGSRWSRVRSRYRILAIVGVQVCMLLIVGLSLLAIKKGGRNATPESKSTATTLTSPDASPPSNLTITSGTFALAMGTPQQQSSACLRNTNESAAWTCFPHSLRVNLLPPPAQQQNSTWIEISLDTPTSTSPNTTQIRYGPQTPVIGSTTLRPAMDTAAPGSRWAYHFQAVYNRTVLVRDALIGAPGAVADGADVEDADEDVRIGDLAWLCTFSDVRVEGYVYVDQAATGRNETRGSGLAPGEVRVLPYAVRYTEQRVAASGGAFCYRMVVQSNSTMLRVEPRVMLQMGEAGVGARSESVGGREAGVLVRQEEDCRCQWMVQ